jgi:hypothetical protein
MIAASAALCATVGLCVESANVVGYQNKSVRQDLSQQVCTFDQIGVAGGVLDIQKLIPVDSEGDYVGEGDINIQFKSSLGVLQAAYAYYGPKELNKKQTEPGWYDEDTEELAEYEFASGEGFQVQASSACYFNYSGEVNMAETDVPFRKDLSMQGNIRPTSVDIQDIIPVDGEGEYIGYGEVNIQFASSLGVLQAAYAYYGPKELSKKQTVAGWYDEDTEELAEYTFAAGEGFKIQAGTAGYLRFPEL